MSQAEISYLYPIGEPMYGPFGYNSIQESLRGLDIDPADYVVIGGANLVLRGIKLRTPDIDMLVSDDLFAAWSQAEGVKMKLPPLSARRRGATNQTAWFRTEALHVPISATTSMGDGYYPISFNSEHPYAEMIEGVPCLPLESVKRAKEALQRPGDIEDLKRIAHFLGESLHLPPPTVPLPYGES